VYAPVWDWPTMLSMSTANGRRRNSRSGIRLAPVVRVLVMTAAYALAQAQQQSRALVSPMRGCLAKVSLLALERR